MDAPLPPRKRIAMVAHDSKKDDLIAWAKFNSELLARHDLVATGTTGRLLAEHVGLKVQALLSGPLGGDQQIGALIAEGRVDMLIFFWDPLSAQPHDPDVKALLRLAAAWNIPVATNRATADFLVSSPLMESAYARVMPDYSGYVKRLDEP